MAKYQTSDFPQKIKINHLKYEIRVLSSCQQQKRFEFTGLFL